jgi:hypothetical protein
MNDSRQIKTVEAAVEHILGQMPAADRSALRALPRGDLQLFYYGWSMQVAERLGLLDENEDLLRACAERVQANEFAMRIHPDCAVTVIIEALWAKLQAG